MVARKPVNERNKMLFSDCFTAVTNKYPHNCTNLWRCPATPDSGISLVKLLFPFEKIKSKICPNGCFLCRWGRLYLFFCQVIHCSRSLHDTHFTSFLPPELGPGENRRGVIVPSMEFSKLTHVRKKNGNSVVMRLKNVNRFLEFLNRL